MTPYEISILLHYHTRRGDPEDISTPIGPMTTDYFVTFGLLERRVGDARQRFKITEKGNFYVTDGLGKVPLPEHVWRIPPIEADK